MPRAQAALLPIALEASALCTGRPGGVSRYARELAEALFALAACGEVPYDFQLACRLSLWRQRAHCPESAPRLWYQEPLPLLGQRPLLLHATDPLHLPAWRGVQRVATLHGVHALLSDQWDDPARQARRSAAYRALPARCARIIAVSESLRRDFLARVLCPPERVVVVHKGLNPIFTAPPPAAERQAVLARHGLAEGPPYLLFVGGIDRRHNLLGLLRALLAEAALGDHRLAVAGGEGYGAAELLADPAARRLGERLRLLGPVADAELPALYAGAAALCLPSLAAGFGAPLLEAMACGTPVAAADRGALPEIAGGHAQLADPASPGDLAAALLAAIATPPAAREAARRHAAQFTWERAARATLRVYTEALAAPA